MKSAANNVYQRTKSDMLKSFSILVVAFVLLTATVVAIPLRSAESEAAVAGHVDLHETGYTGSSVEANHENKDVLKSEDDEVDDMELSDDAEDEEALKLKGAFDVFKGKIWGRFCGIKCISTFTRSDYDFSVMLHTY